MRCLLLLLSGHLINCHYECDMVVFDDPNLSLWGVLRHDEQGRHHL